MIYIQWSSIQLHKGNSDTHYNMDEPWRHCAEWNKLDTGGGIFNSACMSQNPRDRKQNGGCQRLGRGVEWRVTV